MTVSVLLVRHGESTWNADGRWQGQADPPLSERGRHQARASRVPAVDVVLASDLVRAKETATRLAAPVGLPVVVDERLRERDAGAFSGLTRTEIHQRYPGLLPDDPVRPAGEAADGLRPPPGWEPDEALASRAWAALEAAARTPGIGSVLAVTHSGLIYAIERDLGAERARIANLEGRWVRREATGWVLGERLLLVDPERVAITSPDAL